MAVGNDRVMVSDCMKCLRTMDNNSVSVEDGRL